MSDKQVKKTHIKSSLLAAYLMMKGFVLLGVKRDYDNMFIYFFNKSDDLIKSIEEYKNNNDFRKLVKILRCK